MRQLTFSLCGVYDFMYSFAQFLATQILQKSFFDQISPLLMMFMVYSEILDSIKMSQEVGKSASLSLNLVGCSARAQDLSIAMCLLSSSCNCHRNKIPGNMQELCASANPDLA